jgi:hypothetical protein
MLVEDCLAKPLKMKKTSKLQYDLYVSAFQSNKPRHGTIIVSLCMHMVES